MSKKILLIILTIVGLLSFLFSSPKKIHAQFDECNLPLRPACQALGGCCMSIGADGCVEAGGYSHGSAACDGIVDNIVCCSDTEPSPTPTRTPNVCPENYECIDSSGSCGDGIPGGVPTSCQNDAGNSGDCCVPQGEMYDYCTTAGGTPNYGGQCGAVCLDPRGDLRLVGDFEDCRWPNIHCCVDRQTATECSSLGGMCVPETVCNLSDGYFNTIGNRGDYGCTATFCCVPFIFEWTIGDIPVETPLGGDCPNPESELDTAIGCIPIDTDQAILEFFLTWAIGMAGGIAFILIVYSGFLFTTSRGDPQKIQAAKELFTSALAGLLFLLFSVTILRFIGVDVLQLPWV